MLYVIVFFLSVSLTFLMRKIAIKKSLLAIPNARSSHTVPTPHGGGVAIAVSWFAGIFYLHFRGEIDTTLFYALVIGIIISSLSFIDDLIDLSAKVRLLAQSFAAILALYILGGLHSIDLVVFSIENIFITNIFAFFMILWFINLYNFLDGIDGYAGSEGVFLAIAGFVFFGADHFIILAVSILGFLMWNWHKAKIFMGDSGSTLLGYNVAIFSLYYQNEEHSILIWLVLFGLFWFDATLTLWRRFKEKEKLGQAHKKHAYQRLTQVGWNHDKVTIAGMMINLVLFSLVFFLQNKVVAFLFAILFLYGIIKFVDKKKAF